MSFIKPMLQLILLYNQKKTFVCQCGQKRAKEWNFNANKEYCFFDFSIARPVKMADKSDSCPRKCMNAIVDTLEKGYYR